MAMQVLILGEKDVRRCLSMKQCLAVNRQAFLRLTTPNVVVPSRLGLAYPQPTSKSHDWTLFKPAAFYSNNHHFDGNDTNGDIVDDDTTITTTRNTITMGMKLVSIRANNPSIHNQPLVPATLMMIQADTGMLEALISATYLTAARTATGPALATQLCRPDATHGVIFGAGLQAETHMDALTMSLPHLSHITIINRTKERANSLMQQKQEQYPYLTMNTILLSDTEAVHGALGQADVICTTTNAQTPLFQDGHVKPGCHINSIGSYTPNMTEIPPHLVNRCTVLMDTVEARTVGDLKHLTSQHPTCLLGQVLQEEGNTWLDDNRMEYTFFKGVGTAIQDVMTGALVLERARELGLGTAVDMS